MTTSTKIAATTAIALLLAVTGSANAASIEDQLTDQQVSTFCVNQPIGSDVQAAATLAGGLFVSGTVHCDASDVAALASNGNQNGGWSSDDDDDSYGDDDSHGDDEGGDDHGDDSDHGGDDDGHDSDDD